MPTAQGSQDEASPEPSSVEAPSGSKVLAIPPNETPLSSPSASSSPAAADSSPAPIAISSGLTVETVTTPKEDTSPSNLTILTPTGSDGSPAYAALNDPASPVPDLKAGKDTSMKALLQIQVERLSDSEDGRSSASRVEAISPGGLLLAESGSDRSSTSTINSDSSPRYLTISTPGSSVESSPAYQPLPDPITPMADPELYDDSTKQKNGDSFRIQVNTPTSGTKEEIEMLEIPKNAAPARGSKGRGSVPKAFTFADDFELPRIRSSTLPQEDLVTKLVARSAGRPPKKSPHHRSLSQPRIGVLGTSRRTEATSDRSLHSIELVPMSDFSVPASPRSLIAPETNQSIFLAETSHDLQYTIRRIKALSRLDGGRRFISAALTNYVQSEESYRENKWYYWVGRILVFMAISIFANVFMLVFQLQDPYLPYAETTDGQAVFAYFICPYATFFACTGVLMHILTVNNTPLPFWKLAICSISSSIVIGACPPLMGHFNIFPIPYFPVTGGVLALGVALVPCIAFQPMSVLKNPVMRKKLPWLLLMIQLNVGSAFLYAFYVSLFSTVQGHWQTAVAPLLAVVKFVVKHVTARIARRLDNPDFVHGTALYTDLAGTCVSSIIFVNVNAIQTFLLLLTIDTAINLRHCLRILQVVTTNQKEKHQQIVRRLCVSRRDAVDCAIALEEIRHEPLTPHLVELCGDMFFAELTESVVPLIMGFSAWIVYNYPNCNRQYITYMWQNNEADFNNGMGYVLLDCGVQLVLLFCLLWYMQFKVGIPIAHVGVTIMNKDKGLFVWMMLGVCVFFFLIFIDHAGVDTSFQFAWLRPEFNATAQNLLRHQRAC